MPTFSLQTYPSFGDLWISCPSFNHIAEVVEVAEAELHPVSHGFLQTLLRLSVDWMFIEGVGTPQCSPNGSNGCRRTNNTLGPDALREGECSHEGQ